MVARTISNEAMQIICQKMGNIQFKKVNLFQFVTKQTDSHTNPIGVKKYPPLFEEEKAFTFEIKWLGA